MCSRVLSTGDSYPSFGMVSPASEMTVSGEVNLDMTITADL